MLMTLMRFVFVSTLLLFIAALQVVAPVWGDRPGALYVALNQNRASTLFEVGSRRMQKAHTHLFTDVDMYTYIYIQHDMYVCIYLSIYASICMMYVCGRIGHSFKSGLRDRGLWLAMVLRSQIRA